MIPVLCSNTAQFRAACDNVRAQGGTLGLVPTMGALHRGHVALMQQAQRVTTHVAVTIFVNPTQFAAGEDLGQYPRSLEKDTERCHAAGVQLLFVPAVQEMYPTGDATRVRVSGLTDVLCGGVRPGHFEGVATVVTKLFGLAGTCTAIFGRKDYQQLKVIERLVLDLMLPVKIIGHPIVREADGLALSSRNSYLSVENRQRASALVKGLSKALRSFLEGERRAPQILDCVRSELATEGLRQQYVDLADADTLEILNGESPVPERALLAVAAYCGQTRLIDNIVLGEDSDPL
jgi:pantoate--beta-alanine ligase